MPITKATRKKTALSLSDYEKRSECKELKEKPLCIHFSSRFVWVGCDKGALMVFNARDCSLVTIHKVHDTRIYSIASVSRQIWISSENGSLYVFDSHSPKLLKEIPNAHETFMIRYLFPFYSETLSSMWTCSPEQSKICVWDSEVCKNHKI